MPQWKMVGISEMLLGYKATDDLQQNIGSGDLFMVIYPAGTVADDYAAATSLLPIRVVIGSEQIDVTAAHAAQTNPTAAPTTGITGSGSTLTTGNYTVAYAWRVGTANVGGTTLVSPTAIQAITAGDNLVVTVPARPSGIASTEVYVSQAAGSATLKYAGTTTTTTLTVSANPTGALIPGANTVADTVAILRGVNSTVAASHTAATGIVTTVRDLQMPFTNQFAINPQTTEITFMGDGDQEYVSLHLGMRGTIQSDKWLTTIWEKILGVTDEKTGLPADETDRWYPDAGSYPVLRLRAVMHAIDDTTGLDVAVRLEIPKAQIYPRPWHPSNVGTAAKQTMDLQWTAQRTKTDLVGITLPGTLPSRGVFYNLSQLSTALP